LINLEKTYHSVIRWYNWSTIATPASFQTYLQKHKSIYRFFKMSIYIAYS